MKIQNNKPEKWYKENDNIDRDEIARYMKMPQEERDRLMEEMETEILREIEEDRIKNCSKVR